MSLMQNAHNLLTENATYFGLDKCQGAFDVSVEVCEIEVGEAGFISIAYVAKASWQMTSLKGKPEANLFEGSGWDRDEAMQNLIQNLTKENQTLAKSRA